MTPGHLLGLWQAETVKLLSRLSARIAILCAIVLGFLGPIMLFSIGNSEMVINGSPVAETMNLTAPQGSIWSLNVRNFFLMRAFIIMLAGLSFAGEFSKKDAPRGLDPTGSSLGNSHCQMGCLSGMDRPYSAHSVDGRKWPWSRCVWPGGGLARCDSRLRVDVAHGHRLL